MKLSENFKGNKKEVGSYNSKLYLRLRANIVLSFISITIAALLIFGLISYQQSRKAIDLSYRKSALQSINHTGRSLDTYLDSLVSATRVIISDSHLSEIYRKPLLTELQTSSGHLMSRRDFINRKIAMLPKTVYSSDKNIEGIYVYYADNIYTVYSRSQNPPSIPSRYFSSLYSEMLRRRVNILTVGTDMRFYGKGVYNNTIAVAGLLDSNDPDSGKAIFIVDYAYQALDDILGNITAPAYKGSEFMVVDSSGAVMYHPDPGLLTTKPSLAFLKGLDTEGSVIDVVDRNGYAAYTAVYKSPEHFWKAVSIVPAASVFSELFAARTLMIILAIVTILFVLVVTFMSSSFSLRPLNELSAAVSRYEGGDLNSNPGGLKSFRRKKDTDTTGPISKIEGIVDKVYSIQLDQKEAQLKSLQNQINPHFLYNTLESIRGAALYHGIPSIASMAKCLSLFFRYSISDEILVNIKDELQHLENYIAIQNFRHDDKFELVYNIPERLYTYKILKLTLQPLVENSIKHGLEMKLGKGKIRIEILNLVNVMKIEIHDNGIGLPPGKLEELNSMLEKGASPAQEQAVSPARSPGTGIGVKNVNSRIKLYFGEQYGLRYRESQEGTTVEVTLPIVES